MWFQLHVKRVRDLRRLKLEGIRKFQTSLDKKEEDEEKEKHEEEEKSRKRDRLYLLTASDCHPFL